MTIGKDLYEMDENNWSWAAGYSNYPNNSVSSNASSYNMPSMTNQIIKETVPGIGIDGGFDYSNLTGKDWLNLGLGKSKDLWGSMNTKSGWDSIGSMLGGFGKAASGWAALKGLGLTKQAMADYNKQWEKDYKSGVITTDNQVAQTNAWLDAQGRKDFHNYVDPNRKPYQSTRTS